MQYTRSRRPRIETMLLAFLIVGAGVNLGVAEGASKKGRAAEATADDLMVVDCLLPAKIRRLGTRSNYLAPRQPERTTAVRCRIRGGEYTEPDQANYRTALSVWLPQAKAGDAVAQYYVGQIFEKGLGTTADFQGAAEWYSRAAEKGYAPAQVGLGYLHEMGLGVEKDEVEALNWYRKAAGLAEDLVVLEQDDYQSLLESRRAAEARGREVAELEAQAKALRSQLEDLGAAAEREHRERAATFEAILDRLESDLAAKKDQLAKAERKVSALETKVASSGGAESVSPEQTFDTAKLDFGRYYALVIGNSQYQQLPPLEGAVNDATKMAEILKQQYRFDVRLLVDATRVDILRTLNELRETLTEKDNLLVFYAGRGVRDDARDVAYWQPVDSDPENPVNWIPNGVLVDHLDIMPAKHVLVVADSVFSGLRTRSAVAQLRSGATPEKRFFQLRSLLSRRSRLALTAGVEPAADQPETPFSSALVDVLADNGEILEASELHRRLRERLKTSAPDQSPEFATLRWARNDVADFFFVPAG